MNMLFTKTLSEKLLASLQNEKGLNYNKVENLAIFYPRNEIIVLTEVNDTNNTEIENFLSKNKDRIAIFPELPTRLESLASFVELKTKYPSQVYSLGGKLGVLAKKTLKGTLDRNNIISYYHYIKNYEIDEDLLEKVMLNQEELLKAIADLPMVALLTAGNKRSKKVLIVPGGIPVNLQEKRPYTLSEIARAKDSDDINYQLAFNRILTEEAFDFYKDTDIRKSFEEYGFSCYEDNGSGNIRCFNVPKFVKQFVKNEKLDTIVAKAPVMVTVGQYYMDRDVGYIVFNSYRKPQCGPKSFSTVLLIDFKKPRNDGRYSLEFIIDKDEKPGEPNKYILNAYDPNLENKIEKLEEETGLALSNKKILICIENKNIFDATLKFLEELEELYNRSNNSN